MLPVEILNIIYKYCNYCTKLQLRLVSRYFKAKTYFYVEERRNVSSDWNLVFYKHLLEALIAATDNEILKTGQYDIRLGWGYLKDRCTITRFETKRIQSWDYEVQTPCKECGKGYCDGCCSDLSSE